MGRIPAAVRSLLAASSLLALAGTASTAQDRASEVVSLERLKFEKKCVFEIREWQGKGAEEIFLQRLEAQRAAYAAKEDTRLPQLIDLVVEILWAKHEQFVAKDDHEQGSEYAARTLRTGKNEKGELLGGEKTKELLGKADTYIVDRKFAAAEAALAGGKTDEAKGLYRGLLDTSKKAAAVTAIIDIDKKATDFDRSQQGDADERILGLGRFADALEASLGSADYNEIKELRTQKSKLEGNTQLASVSWIDTSAAVAGVKIGKPVSLDKETALFAFVPVGAGTGFPPDGKPVKFPEKGRVRLERGTYTVRVFAPGEAKACAVWPAQVLGDAMVTISVPTRIPEGMVYCPPAAAGGEALFVDRTEVTLEQVQAVRSAELETVIKDSTQGIADPVGIPAWFYEEKSARAFERASGKRIPTVQQWLHAAFAAGDARYPWGNDEPDMSRAYMAPEDETSLPRRAGGRERGASPYGIEDMAGNMAEWVRYGSGDSIWMLGGHHMMTNANLASLSGASPLRKPMPGHEAYSAMPGAEKNNWQQYRFKNGPDDNPPMVAGLRMVVPVKP
jgi:hypothetical protein